MPRGLGPNVELKVAIVSVTGTAESAPILYNYTTPSIVTVSPNPFDASGGQKLAIYGYNLGLVGLGPKPVVHLNGASTLALLLSQSVLVCHVCCVRFVCDAVAWFAVPAANLCLTMSCSSTLVPPPLSWIVILGRQVDCATTPCCCRRPTSRWTRGRTSSAPLRTTRWAARTLPSPLVSIRCARDAFLTVPRSSSPTNCDVQEFSKPPPPPHPHSC